MSPDFVATSAPPISFASSSTRHERMKSEPRRAFG